MGFLVFDTQEPADRARDLRAKAEGYPMGETLRCVDWQREPMGPRYSIEFDEAWAEAYLPTCNGEQHLTTEEIAELEATLANLQAELPVDWKLDPPEPEEEPEPEAEPA